MQPTPYNSRTHTHGYSLVEVLVAISVLLLATVGPMTIAARSLQYAQFSAEQNTAFFLAQEGIEAIYKVRADRGLQHFANTSNNSWRWANVSALSWCRNGGCGIDWVDDAITSGVRDCRNNTSACRIYFNPSAGRARYSHNSSGGTATPYVRVIDLENIAGTEAVMVRSTVTWNSRNNGENREVVLETYLHDIYDTSD